VQHQPRTRAQLAQYLDHSLLVPEATDEDVVALCAVAAAERVATACVLPPAVGVSADLLRGTGVGVSSVIGFPSGSHRTVVKVLEIEVAVADGATELDVVINLGNVHGGDWHAVRHELQVLRYAARHTPIKLACETGTLIAEQIKTLCLLAVDEGIDMVKTSTGFHAHGGATVSVVKLMADLVGQSAGVKASGGVDNTAEALAMIEAGATRIGCSATIPILDGMPA
jgi:deoxyribose-phosphate aldolase